MFSQSADAKSLARMGTTQFLNATLAETKPIFARSRINHTPSHPVTHLCSANKRIVLVLANKTVARFDMSKPDGTMELVDISKCVGPRAKINKVSSIYFGKSRDQFNDLTNHWLTGFSRSPRQPISTGLESNR